MKAIIMLASVAVCLLLAAGSAFAQGVGASGDITGTVMDPSGAVVPNATVTATEAQKGLKRTTTSDSKGEYRLAGLPPSTYEVSTQLPGFRTSIQKVVVNVGQTVILDFHLSVTQVSEQVEVTTEAPVVETEKTHQANTLDQQLISDLPINRRDYLTFTLLTPGVADSTRMADNTDFRVKQTPQSGLALYGSNGRGNSVTVDGGEYNDDAGGVRFTLSQDAVQEFQVNRSNYNAELGSASGASINIVSKTGTNDLHGSLYSFFRNDALDARDPFAITQALTPGSAFSTTAKGTATKDALQRYQFGGTLGFPLKKDKTFMFLSAEGLLRNEQHAVPLLTDASIFNPTAQQNALLSALAARGGAPVPCLNGGPMIPAATCAGILQNALTVSPTTGLKPINTALNNFVINQLEANGGLFPFNEREYLGSARLDHQFSDHDQAFLRFTTGHDVAQDPDVQALTGFSRGSTIRAYDITLQGAWFHQFSAKTLNEVRLQGNYNNFSVLSNDPAGPGFDIPGFATLGGGIFLPAFTIGRRGEAAENLTLIRGSHTMKTGFYGLLHSQHVDSHTFFPGRFVFGQLPGAALSPCLAASANATPISPPTSPNACGLNTLGAVINSLQSFSLGAPQFYQQGFDGNVYPSGVLPWVAGYWQDSWQIRPNLTLSYGLRYELDQRYQINTDKDNFAPRVSFAWDPFKDHKTVVRGGYGIFYAPTYGQIDGVARSLGVLDAHGHNVPESMLTQCGISITCSREIDQVFIPFVAAGGVRNAQNVFQTLFGQGAFNCPVGGSQTQPNCITAAMLAQFGIPVTHTGVIPALSVTFNASPDYQNPLSHQLEFGIEREVAKGFSVSASGIYVHTLRQPRAIDTNLLPAAPITSLVAGTNGLPFQNWSGAVPGSPCAVASNCFAIPAILQTNVYTSTAASLYEGGILEVKKRFSQNLTLIGNYTYSHAWDDTTDFNSDFEASNQITLFKERSLSAFDQRHKIVVAGILDSPWKSTKDASLGEKIFGNFQLSPIVRYNSSRPFNLLAGTNVNNDRHSTNDRPPGAGRNTGVGPNLVTFDMRVSRQFKLTEKANMQFMAEGFNIFNRTNFASVNNTVGADFTPPFNVSGSQAASPSQPLGFTSALARRQLQFGLRFGF
ncbi:MAG TPA: TonB-dependent receptor [Candidatus Angelobacter sp.]|nr:TonB-dependent receptor [Candidatus Angelobacter sp.]